MFLPRSESKHNLMQYLKVPAAVSRELKQHWELKRNIVNKILLSERLLIDHLECLEFCLEQLPIHENRRSDLFTFLNLSVAVTASSVVSLLVLKPSPIIKLALFSTSTALGMLCGVKTFNKLRNILIEDKLNRLVKSVDEFGHCIKREISYFNEAHFVRFIEDDSSHGVQQKERAWECIRSIKTVTMLLYDATRKLEADHWLSQKLSDLYLPMEELRDCDYFKKDTLEYSSKNIKDFYNIFAYVQSQFFLRLAFTVIEQPFTNFLQKLLETITIKIEIQVREEQDLFKKISTDLQKKKKDAISVLYKNHELHKNKYGASTILKESSLKLSSGLIAVAEECYKLDEALQRISDDDDVKAEGVQNVIFLAGSMRSIENSLSVCCDNFQRLMIMYNKFLGGKINAEESLELHDEEVSDDKTTAPQLTTESCEHEKSDDFYAYMFDEQSNDEADNSDTDKSLATDYQLFNLDESITRKKFKPVLQQLKGKIDPIRQEMLEKERKILEAKGVNVDKLFAVEKTPRASSDDDSDSEGSFEDTQKRKKSKPDHFEEMRQFLAQKSASNPSVNLFNLQLPIENVVTEDILE